MTPPLTQNRDLEQDLLFIMHDVARLIRVEADRRARLIGLTRAQWALLVRLEQNPGLSQTEIAALLEVEPISVARLVDRLANKQLVERRADAQDRRIWRLHLCDKAQDVLQHIQVQRRDLSAMLYAGLAPEAHAALVSGLLAMKANLLKPPAPVESREVA